MTPITTEIEKKHRVLLGNFEELSTAPKPAFSDICIDFFDHISKEIFAHPRVREFSDLAAFAYWSRKRNLEKIKSSYNKDGIIMMGLGLSFHICPSNTPINFLYSLAFSLLSGNTAVLRISEKNSDVYGVSLGVISAVLKLDIFRSIANDILIFRSSHDDELISFWSSNSSLRVIWGGDETINRIRMFPTPVYCRDVMFPDRYSISVIKASCISDCNIDLLVESLYRDIYTFDQAACSSPQLFYWLLEDGSDSYIISKVWDALSRYAGSKYSISPIDVIDKFVGSCEAVVELSGSLPVNVVSPELTVLSINDLGAVHTGIRGCCGTVFQYTSDSLDELVPIINRRFQTMTYFGLERSELCDFVLSNSLPGIDRIVPVGSALDMDNIWDGYDIITHFTRVIKI